MKEKVGQLTVDLEKTKADNVKLYGKIRYVQDYNLEKVVSRGSKKVTQFCVIFKNKALFPPTPSFSICLLLSVTPII